MKPHHRVHLEIQTLHAQPVSVMLRLSFRENGKIKYANHGRITGLPLDQLQLIQAAFCSEVVPINDPQAFQTVLSKECGTNYAIHELVRQLDLDRLLYSRHEALGAGLPGHDCGPRGLRGHQVSPLQSMEEHCAVVLFGTASPIDDAAKKNPAIQLDGFLARNERHFGRSIYRPIKPGAVLCVI